MATALPRPSPPPFNPPTVALPPLPTPKTRKSLPTPTSALRSPTNSHVLAQAPRTPSVSQLPTKTGIKATSRGDGSAVMLKSQHAQSTPSVATLRSTSSAAKRDISPNKDKLRRTISIAAFPQPPKVVSRIGTISSRPPSGGSPRSSVASEPFRSTLGGSSTPTTPGGSLRARKLKPKASTDALRQFHMSSVTPSLLNGSGEGKSITVGAAEQVSDVRLSQSPAHSRSSSAQGSYSTSATTFEDLEDNQPRGRTGPEETSTNAKRRSKAKEQKGNVLVSVRVRPDLSGNDDRKSDGEWMVDGRRSLVAFNGREGGDYYYGKFVLFSLIGWQSLIKAVDNVFSTNDRNDKVYDSSAKRLVRRVMEGYHGTVFAYGMTGTGKTFSMQGTTSSPGVIPLAITDIFSYIRETPHREFLLRVSYLEIYNEKIHDLLSSSTGGGMGVGSPGQEEIKLREDSKRGVYASPLKEEIVQSPTQLLRVIARGDHARRTASTLYNSRSSRSHAVVQIVVESRERVAITSTGSEDKRAPIAPSGVRVSTLSLIDLAGSERAAENKDRQKEGAHINKSLLTLGTVIARLSGDKDKNGNPTDKDGKHLPYRDSKLTRLLQAALSGSSLVSILCTIQIGSTGSIATANSHTAETLNTLKFAARAKNNIISHAKKSEEALGNGADAASRGLLERYQAEIQTLRSQLDIQAKVQTEKDEKQLEKDAEQRHEEQMLEMQLARTALKERIEHLNRLIISSKSIGVNTNGSLSSLSMHPKLVAYANSEHGTKSMRSSGSHSTVGAQTPLRRSMSGGASTATIDAQGINTQSPAGQSPCSPYAEGEDEDTMGQFADGAATLQAQNRALQADLADKNRYISTLERRLLQARRSSHSRASLAFSQNLQQHRDSSTTLDEGMESSPTLASTVQDKDAEIARLHAQLEDKERMLTALRAATRKRESANDTAATAIVTTTIRKSRTSLESALRSPPPLGMIKSTAETSTFPSLPPSPHKSLSSQSSSQNSANNFSLSPVAILSSPTKTSFSFNTNDHAKANMKGNAVNSSREISPLDKNLDEDRIHKRKSVDEMSRILDEMIQDRVERGDLGRKGSTLKLPARKASLLQGVPSVGALARGLRFDEED
ncbi:hypothetical protein MMC09_005783 [Bachmanniomyces sp. S44760]|nr:hypothetical protein [Bachmanniomyces sp. S44760]